MNEFLQLCINIPNIGTLVFFLVFVLLVPVYFITQEHYNMLKYYLPALIMVASTLTTSGAPDFFTTLYQPNPESLGPWLSKNFINLMAIIGIMLNGLVVGIASGSVMLGLVICIIAFTIAFPVGNTVIPFFIRQMAQLLETNTTFKYPGNWHKYFIGFVFIVLFLTLQSLLMRQANVLVASGSL
jgi:hypothetical protein